jgi:hypothetical protein
VRSIDITAGIDAAVGPEVRFADLFPGVRLALDPGALSTPPADHGVHLFSFAPRGTATSGTIYIGGRDGARFAVRVFGPTSRTRVLRYDTSTGTYVERLF